MTLKGILMRQQFSRASRVGPDPYVIQPLDSLGPLFVLHLLSLYFHPRTSRHFV